MNAKSAAQQELAPTGTLRAAINCANTILAQCAPVTGALTGPSVDIAQEIARQLGVACSLHPVEESGQAMKAMREGTCDVAFLAFNPGRAADVDFTAPYLLIEGGYVVPARSSLKTVTDVDRPGIRIASEVGAAYDHFLSQNLKHATLVHAPDGEAALNLFETEKLDALAGLYQALQRHVEGCDDRLLLGEPFCIIRQSVVCRKGQDHARAFLDATLKALKSGGFIKDVLSRSGNSDIRIAPDA